jgi:outer membrane immunogenic protein
MKKLLLGSVALVAGLGLGAAMAADMPVYLKAPPPVYSWTGIYIGGNLGYSWGNSGIDNVLLNPPFPPVTTSDSFKLNGVIGGGQIGANWQTGSFLIGLETDIQASGENGGNTVLPCVATNPSCDGVTLSKADSEKLAWFGTTRGRLGVVANNWLLYGTGGVAYGGISYSSTTTAVVGGVGTVTTSASQTVTGWAAGGGVEVLLDRSHWTGRLEYLHLDFPALSPVSIVVAGFPINSTFHRTTDDIVRGAINYKILP